MCRSAIWIALCFPACSSPPAAPTSDRVAPFITLEAPLQALWLHDVQTEYRFGSEPKKTARMFAEEMGIKPEHLFANATDEEGYISQEAFEECFEELVAAGPGLSAADEDKVRLVLGRLYDIFDTDGNGVVSFDEFASGISVLCGGSREDKVRAAFALFDLSLIHI